MANGEFASPRDGAEDVSRRHLLRMQSPGRYLCAIDGGRSYVWENDRDSRQGAL